MNACPIHRKISSSKACFKKRYLRRTIFPRFCASYPACRPSWEIFEFYFILLCRISLDFTWLFYSIILLDYITRLFYSISLNFTNDNAGPKCRRQPFYSCSLHVRKMLIVRFIGTGCAAFTGFETRNKYNVVNFRGEPVFYVEEESGICERLCLGSYRSCEFRVMTSDRREVLRMVRPLRCNNCCCPCCLQVHAYISSFRGVQRNDGSKLACILDWEQPRQKYLPANQQMSSSMLTL